MSGIRRSFSGHALPTTLASELTATAMTVSVTATTGWPDTTDGPFIITVDKGKSSLEEKIEIESYSGTTLTVATNGRGADGTTPQIHRVGATVVHTIDADTINHANEVAANTGVVTPSTQAIGDNAVKGTQTGAPAAGDHKHKMPSFTTGATTEVAPGESAADGSSASPARADHRHDLAELFTKFLHGVVTDNDDDTARTVTSATYVELPEAPSVTATTGTSAIVIVSALVITEPIEGTGQVVMASWKCSGASTIAGSDYWAVRAGGSVEGMHQGISFQNNASRIHLVTGLTPGENTFTVVNRIAGGTSGQVYFRSITVIPLP